ncbi:phosphoesterase [Streptomyces sp. LBUM 1483]|nr:phosphoesterase [Streptomyces sp. LBUM 1485]MBP5893009.1 phosphoesterase [Streptomyces sp. LBUM 1481]MBP5923270.1 phosphoesterase [Streptomyces sp. LBUM 1483]QTU54579.1 phosphoesterase [Streptomyces sp. LBUM 1480]
MSLTTTDLGSSSMCDDRDHDHAEAGRNGHGDGDGDGDRDGLGRRALFVTSAAAALTLGSVTFGTSGAEAAHGDQETRTIRGTLPTGSPDFVYLPVEVPSGVRELRVSYSYDRPSVPAGTPGNALDIGVFDERGTDLGGKGFRGWSGGARSEFFLRTDEATPGYLPGPVRPGTWHIALGPYTVAPDGLPYEITITLTYGTPAPVVPPVYPPERAEGRGRAWYRGDCHLHSWYSDGRRTLGELAALARAAGLDFINSSEHNTPSAHAHWAEHAGDDLLVMLGEEVTTRNGHVVALGIDPGTFVDWRYRARDNRFGRYARQIRRAGGLVVPAHPHATCVGCNWKFGFGEADAVEVWNGAYSPEDEVALADWDGMLVASVKEGRGWIPAMGNSDAHRDPDPVGRPQTVVLADDLTREAVQEGLRAGRSYVAESKDVSVSFTATGARGEHAGIGERLEVAPDTPVTVRLEATGSAGCSIRFVTDQGVLFTSAALPESGTGSAEWRTTASYAAYVRAEVRRPPIVPGFPGPLAAFTNPIFLGRR